MNETTHYKKYFHDRFVLLMLTLNFFLAFVTAAVIFLRLGDTSTPYIESYRQNLGLNAYSVGGAGQIISFAAFSALVMVGQFFISLKLHRIRKHAAWAVMLLASLLLILSLIVSNALLELR